LDAEDAFALFQRRCPPQELTIFEEHVDECPTCRRFLAEIARAEEWTVGGAPTVASEEETGSGLPLQGGDKLGRFEVDHILGQGGMGVVYAARDPELGRMVAIKLLHERARGQEHTERLRREARAMARVPHPNVAQVYEVGRHGEQIFLAMERIDGPTLRKWLRQEPRTWKEVVNVFLKAGQGLAAAHGEGLVHRDFKPDNVLIAQDRVVVTDFGLVQSHSPDASPEPEPDREAEGDVEGISLTRTGAILGTPAYMSPEQLESREIDARTDQFSFCVALFEALYGKRPFPGSTITSLRNALQHGVLQVPENTPKVPTEMHRILSRGLAYAPEDRFSTMEELLDRLRRALSPKRRWLPPAIALGAGLAATALFALGAGSNPDASCPAPKSPWNSQLESALVRRLSTNSVVPAMQNRLRDALVSHAESWSIAHVEACKDTRVRGHQSESILDLRMACLRRQLRYFESHTAELTDSSSVNIDTAIAASLALASPQTCSNIDLLESKASGLQTIELSEAERTLDRELAAIDTKMHLGEIKTALERIQALRPRLETSASPMLAAEAGYLRAQLLEDSGELEDAKAAYDGVLPYASKAKDEALIARVWIRQLHLVGAEQKNHALARELERVAELAIARASDSELEPLFVSTMGVIAHSKGDYERAEELIRKALAGYRELPGDRHPQVLQLMHNLGEVLQRRGEYEAANEVLERVLTEREKLYGREHSSVASTTAQVAHYYLQKGDYAKALERYRQSLKIRRRTLGENSPNVAASRTMVGIALSAMGRNAEARREHESALDIWQRRLGAKHAMVATAYTNLGNTYFREGKYDEAREHFESSLAITKAELGEKHPEVTSALFNLGNVARIQDGDCEHARPYWQKTLEIREKTLDPDHPHLAFPLTSLGECLVDEGRSSTAKELLERALVIRKAKDTDPLLTAETRFALARALWAESQRERALELARTASESFATSANHAEQLSEVEKWLATR
jgi:serine/threonine protein kinase/Tfp pilus assembly protein PilF